jgi:hypothetical protein
MKFEFEFDNNELEENFVRFIDINYKTPTDTNYYKKVRQIFQECNTGIEGTTKRNITGFVSDIIKKEIIENMYVLMNGVAVMLNLEKID